VNRRRSTANNNAYATSISNNSTFVASNASSDATTTFDVEQGLGHGECIICFNTIFYAKTTVASSNTW
jgi:hypothetical protein